MSTPLKKISIHSSGEQARTQCERTSIFGHFVGIWGSQCNSCFLLVGIWGTQTQTKINPSYYQFYKNLQLQLQEWWVNVWKTQPRIRSSLNLCFGVYSVKSAKTGQRSIKLWDQPALPFNAGVGPRGGVTQWMSCADPKTNAWGHGWGGGEKRLLLHPLSYS